MEDSTLAQLFQWGGDCPYPDGDMRGASAIVHILHRVDRYFREHGPEEILRISAEYVSFSRGPGEA
eukprot:3556020-Prorocentrum_lima.AAC.1